MESIRDLPEREPSKLVGKFKLPGIRYFFVFMSFLGLCFLFAVRVNLSVAIIAMVNQTAVRDESETKEDCPTLILKPQNLSDPFYREPKDGEFHWSPNVQGMVLGSFYYLYSVPQIPGGRLSEIYSGKYVFVGGIGLSLFLTLFTPIAARHSVGMLVAVRVMMGVVQGVAFPAIFNLMGRWLPDSERSLLQNIIISGINIGSFVAIAVTGILCDSGILGGWPSAFYLIGIAGLFYCVLWCLLITDTPHTHPCMSIEELDYITEDQERVEDFELPPMPWKRVLSSIALWSVVIAQVGSDWCYYTLLNDLPVFFSTILHFEIEENGFLCAFPYLLEVIVAIVSGYISDVIIRREMVTVIFARKLFNTMAGIGAALGLIGVILAECNVISHISLFAFVMAVTGFCYSGYLLVIIDMSPEYAGTLMGIINTVSTLSGFITSAVVGYLTDKQQTMHQWRIVFAITIILLVVSCIVFVLGATSERQMWNLPEPKATLSFTEIEQPKSESMREQVSSARNS